MNNRERVYALDLENDRALIDAYVAGHRRGGVPAAVIAAIRRSGIERMTIHRLGTRLVMVMTVREGFTEERKAAIEATEPEVGRWEALMARYQRPAPGATDGAKWTQMTPVFDLDDHD